MANVGTRACCLFGADVDDDAVDDAPDDDTDEAGFFAALPVPVAAAKLEPTADIDVGVNLIGFNVVVVRAPRTEVNGFVPEAEVVPSSTDAEPVVVAADAAVVSLWTLDRLADLLAAADKDPPPLPPILLPAKLDWLVCFEPALLRTPVSVELLLLAGRWRLVVVVIAVATVADADADTVLAPALFDDLRMPVAEDGRAVDEEVPGEEFGRLALVAEAAVFTAAAATGFFASGGGELFGGANIAAVYGCTGNR